MNFSAWNWIRLGSLEEDCQIHHRIWRSRGGSEMADNLELLHANCHRQIHVQGRRTEATASRKGR
jgi:5-methylcytosine-specific restriction endonuclease McrA